ncbi:MAG: PAS domain S-box protein, partial [Myxococcales bacterium]
GCVVALNPSAYEILGPQIEQLRGKPFVGYATHSCEEPLQELLAQARRGQVVRGVDLEVRTSDERTVVLAAGASSVNGGAMILLSFRDVTNARNMQRELLKTKEFLEKLVDSSVDAIVAADLRGNIIVFNKSAERILGYGQAEVLGGALNVRRLYPDGVARNIMKMIRSEEHGGVGRLVPTKAELLTRTGELVPVMMSAALILEGDKPVASVGIFSDLRERAKLEAKLSRAQERLQQAERQAVIVELAGTAAHELNQPLTSVMGYAELLKRRMKEDDPSFKAVDIIYREAERMAEIVRKIGKITRYETKAYVGDRRIFDLERASGSDE